MKTSILRLVASLAGALLASAQLSARIVNISTRGTIGAGDRNLITGFVVVGDAPKTILVRGVGPGLATFGLPDAAAAIKVELYDSTGTVIAQNDSYQTSADPVALELTSLLVGAFPLSNAGDSALVATVPAGGYTVVVSAGGDGSALGNALVEVYDADASDSGSAIVNLSGRGMVGSGANALITGFVLAGDTAHSLLFRGVGRDLAQYGVTNPAAAVYLSVCASNGDMLASTQTQAPAVEGSDLWSSVVAFPVSDVGGSTAAVALAPGAYTILVDASPENLADDIGLLEVYDGGRIAVPATPVEVATPEVETPTEPAATDNQGVAIPTAPVAEGNQG